VIGMPETPPGWRVVEQRLDGARLLGRGPERKLQVIWSDAQEADGTWWRHVSVSAFSAPLPRWLELEWVKHHFIGDEHWAYQVHAPRTEHVNINPMVLHLWAPHGGAVLPDFTQGHASI
jgi:hypothetical protein